MNGPAQADSFYEWIPMMRLKMSSARLGARAAAVAACAALLAGGAVVSAEPAQALGCVLGPSLASAAKAAGISCPSVDGAGGEEHWGAAGGACKFGWESSGLPRGIMDFLGSTWVTRKDTHPYDGVTVSTSSFRLRGKLVGQIAVMKRDDQTFTMSIDTWGRDGIPSENVFFDCRTSKDGPIYMTTSVAPSADLMSVPGVPATPAVNGAVAVQGVMTRLGSANFLLRVDLTNSSSKLNIADVQFDLAGYSVDGFPTLPKDAYCQVAEGLVCYTDDLLPGQTETIVLLLHSSGGDGGESVDVGVSSIGAVKTKVNEGSAAVNHRTVVTDFYRIDRP